MNQLQTHRKSKGFTQAQLAKRAGISITYLKDLEAGRRTNPSASILFAIGDALGMTLQEVAYLQRSIEKGLMK